MARAVIFIMQNGDKMNGEAYNVGNTKYEGTISYIRETLEPPDYPAVASTFDNFRC